VHTYAAAGSYSVILTVDGSKTNQKTIVITAGTVNLGSGDIGVLNYAYALEQLEAAFYTTVVADAAFASTFTDATERRLLTDIHDHEIAHREFFKAALATNAIKGLTPNFSTIDFKSRTSVLTAAKTFEDLGVMAYNGAGKLFSNSGNGLT
jgi:PKD repeat protein